MFTGHPEAENLLGQRVKTADFLEFALQLNVTPGLVRYLRPDEASHKISGSKNARSAGEGPLFLKAPGSFQADFLSQICSRVTCGIDQGLRTAF